ncbi:zinc-dependent metalloprotease [Microlunatus sp. Y2014]|uniref:zinc-dependent metalloprotease n=1 Tax=Microlunatus sp. Y2014 TaxID=3418488 RepID=UPI003DA734CD
MAQDPSSDPDRPDEPTEGDNPAEGNDPAGGNDPAKGNDAASGAGSSGAPGDQDDAAAQMWQQLSQLFGGTGGEGFGEGMEMPQNLDKMMEQLQQAFAQFGGAGRPGGLAGLFGDSGDSETGVNWKLAKDTARKTSAQLGADPTPTPKQHDQLREAVSIVELWLDEATSFAAVAGEPEAWSRADWIESTQKVWQRLVEPVAGSIADAMEQAMTPSGEEAGQLAGMEQMVRPLIRSSGAGMFGIQLGQALAQLAGEVIGATDIGLPLYDRVALLPGGIEKFGDGLDQTETDVRLYLALRECARQRLFHGTNWLRSTLLTLVEEYARGITIDTSALESAVADLDPTNLEELNERLAGDLFTPQRSPEQQAVLVRLETMLALVEGWVDEVVGQAAARWMPAAVPLAETMRRHRATGGPAEATFASLVGLELRPRRLRDAANLWAALREARGPEGRDAVWHHPDVMPTTEDLDDPLGFVSRGPTTGRPTPEDSGIDFDAELAKLLDDETGTGGGKDGDTSDGDASDEDTRDGGDDR